MLDLGCGEGHLSGEARALGHRVVAVDRAARPPGSVDADRYLSADLDGGLPDELTGGVEKFDTVVAADVLEHLRRPDQLLRQLHDVTTPDARILVSFPNFSHWYPRLRVLTGRFDYDRRGILDADHVRFFTARSFRRMVESTGWRVEDLEPVGLPFEVADRGGPTGCRGPPAADARPRRPGRGEAVAVDVRLPVRGRAQPPPRRASSDRQNGAPAGCGAHPAPAVSPDEGT